MSWFLLYFLFGIEIAFHKIIVKNWRKFCEKESLLLVNGMTRKKFVTLVVVVKMENNSKFQINFAVFNLHYLIKTKKLSIWWWSYHKLC